MDKVIFLNTAEAPEIIIESVGGDLRLTGWEQREFHAESDDDHSLKGTTDQAQSLIRFTASADVSVRVPRAARVRIANVGGDAKIKGLEGPLEIQTLGGDLILRQVSVTSLGQVGGDLSAKKVGGALNLKTVKGDVSARSVAGPFSADEVSGDLFLRDVAGPAHARVGGDVILGLSFQPGRPYQFEADGDILCRLAPGASAMITIEADGEVEVEVPGAQVSGADDEKIVTLGGGAALVNLQAGGDVSLTSTTPDPAAMGEFGDHFGEEFGVMAEEFSAQIEAQIESQMADLEKQLSDKLGSLNQAFGSNSAKAEQIAARARRAAERAAERAGATARRGSEHAGRRFGPRPPHPPPGPRLFAVGKTFGHTPASDPVTDAERMSILRMVEQKKINIEEAEKLLAALEGKA